MDDYHIKMQEIQELKEAIMLKRINEELLEHLISNLRWLLHYAQKNKMDLPDKDKIIISLERAMEIVDKIPNYHSQINTEKQTRKDGTEPMIRGTVQSCIVKIVLAKMLVYSLSTFL